MKRRETRQEQMRVVHKFLEYETFDGGVICDLDRRVQEAETFCQQRQIVRNVPVHPTESHRKCVLIISCWREAKTICILMSWSTIFIYCVTSGIFEFSHVLSQPGQGGPRSNRNAQSIHYIDDIMIILETKDQAKSDLTKVINHMTYWR